MPRPTPYLQCNLLAAIPCNNQILSGSKSPHGLFLLFWWGCKLREAKQNTPVVPRAQAEPQGCIPEGTRSPFPSRLMEIQGIQLEILEPRLAPGLSLLEWNRRSVSSRFASKLQQGSKHSSCRMGCSALAGLSGAPFLSVPFPQFTFLSSFSTPYRFPEPCPWHLFSDGRSWNLELYFL